MNQPLRSRVTKRLPQPSRFLVTGANGFLGAHLVSALHSQGHKVTALVRTARGLSGQKRLDQVLTWCGVAPDQRRVTVVEGDVTKLRFGLSQEDWHSLSGSIDEVVHCAASTSFLEINRSELENVNVTGTENVVALATNGTPFHLVSSAFAAGCVDGDVAPTWQQPDRFTNVYEETKHRAEAVARMASAKHGFPLTILRPTIVYGHSETGRSLLFNALYYPVRMVLQLRDLYREDIRRGGTRAIALGVKLLADGSLYLPLRIESDTDTTLNLVPVDYFARSFLALLDGHPQGGTFHIGTDEIIRLATVVDYTQQLYGIRGIEVVGAESFAKQPRSALEKLFQDYTAAYRPYMRDSRRFQVSTLPGASCPRFTFEVFQRLMLYGESVRWGRSLFDQNPA